MRKIRFSLCIVFLLSLSVLATKPASLRLSQNDRQQIVLSVVAEMEKGSTERVYFLVIDEPISTRGKAELAKRYQLIARKDAIAKRQMREGITFYSIGKLTIDRDKVVIYTGYQSGSDQGGASSYGEYKYRKVKGKWTSEYLKGPSFCDAMPPPK